MGNTPSNTDKNDEKSDGNDDIKCCDKPSIKIMKENIIIINSYFKMNTNDDDVKMERKDDCKDDDISSRLVKASDVATFNDINEEKGLKKEDNVLVDETAKGCIKLNENKNDNEMWDIYGMNGNSNIKSNTNKNLESSIKNEKIKGISNGNNNNNNNLSGNSEDINEIYFNVFNSKGIQYFKNKAIKELFYNNDMILAVGKDNKLSIKNGNILTLNDIIFFKNMEVNLVCNGWSKHGFIYTNKNELYSFGNNKSDQCGVQTNEDELKIPELINYSCDSNIIQIECGTYHSLFLTSNGNVYACGNKDYYEYITTFNEDLLYKSKSIEPIIITKNIIKIGCEWMTSFVLTNDNILITEYKRIRNITHFDCGSKHSGYISKNGALYMIGKNYYSQCGLKNNTKTISNDYPNKIQVNNNSSFIHVSCGDAHTIAKTIDGQYYGFGWNKFDELLLNNNNDICLPTLISIEYIKKTIKSNKNIINLIAGHFETLIFTEY